MGLMGHLYEVGNTRWTFIAACKGDKEMTDLFYSTKPQDQRDALTICNEVCLVRDACLEHAMKNGEFQEGIWGGMIPAARRAERRRRVAVAKQKELEERETA